MRDVLDRASCERRAQLVVCLYRLGFEHEGWVVKGLPLPIVRGESKDSDLYARSGSQGIVTHSS